MAHDVKVSLGCRVVRVCVLSFLSLLARAVQRGSEARCCVLSVSCCCVFLLSCCLAAVWRVACVCSSLGLEMNGTSC